MVITRRLLPGNIKDRITSHIEIDHVVIQNEDECAELAARYINAVYLDDAQIQEWKNNGYSSEELPVATIFKQHSWANFKIENETGIIYFSIYKSGSMEFLCQFRNTNTSKFPTNRTIAIYSKIYDRWTKGNFHRY